MKKLLAILLSVILVIGTIIGVNAVVYQFGVGGPHMTLNFYIDSSKVPTTNFTEIEMKIFSSFNTYKDHSVILNNEWIQYGTVEVESSIVGAELSTGYTENQGAVTIFKFKSDEGFELSATQPFLSFTDIPATIYNSSDSINFMVDKLVAADGTDCADNDAVTTKLIVPEGSTVPAYSWISVDNIGLNITNTHRFFNAINQYVEDSNGDIVLSNSNVKAVIDKDNMNNYLRVFEETDELVVFTYVDVPQGTSSETIDGYYFENIFFGGVSHNDSGYRVYYNGKVYTISEATTAGIVTSEHLADILPNSQSPTVPSSETTPTVNTNFGFEPYKIAELKDGYSLWYCHQPVPPWMEMFYYQYGRYIFVNQFGQGENCHGFYIQKDNKQLMLSQAFEEGITDIDEVVSLIMSADIPLFNKTHIVDTAKVQGNWEDLFPEFHINQSDSTEPPTDPPATATEPSSKIQATQPTESSTEPESAQPVVTPEKKANPMKVTVKAKTVKFSKVKKSKQIVAPITVKNAQGKVTFKKLSGSNTLMLKANGNIVIKKGAKKGTYTAKIKVTANGSSKYKNASKTVKIKITVK